MTVNELYNEHHRILDSRIHKGFKIKGGKNIYWHLGCKSNTTNKNKCWIQYNEGVGPIRWINSESEIENVFK